MTSDRLGKLAMNKRINQLRQSAMKKQENQFLDAMRLDLELERRIQAFMEAEEMSATVTREFSLDVRGQEDDEWNENPFINRIS